MSTPTPDVSEHRDAVMQLIQQARAGSPFHLALADYVGKLVRERELAEDLYAAVHSEGIDPLRLNAIAQEVGAIPLEQHNVEVSRNWASKAFELCGMYRGEMVSLDFAATLQDGVDGPWDSDADELRHLSAPRFLRQEFGDFAAENIYFDERDVYGMMPVSVFNGDEWVDCGKVQCSVLCMRAEVTALIEKFDLRPEEVTEGDEPESVRRPRP